MVGVPPTSGQEELVEQVTREAAELPNLELLAPRPRAELLELMDETVAIVNTADSEGMPNIFLEGWARGVPALALAHDPDGVIARHGLGSFADGSMDAFAEQARSLWAAREDPAAAAERCIRYIRDHHSAEAAAEKWGAVIAGSSRAASYPAGGVPAAEAT
jgi:hypothetical protein